MFNIELIHWKYFWKCLLFVAVSEPGEQADILYEGLKTEYPGHLPIHVSMLQLLEPCDVKSQLLQVLFEELPQAVSLDGSGEISLPAVRSPDPKYDRIKAIADVILASVDQMLLLVHIGTRVDQRPDAPKIKRYKHFCIELYFTRRCRYIFVTF